MVGISYLQAFIALQVKANVSIRYITCRNPIRIGAYQTRAGEHISAFRKADTKPYETADHCWKFNHDFNWTEHMILGHELNTTTRKIKETIHSIKTENCVSGISYKLPDFWLPAIKVKHDGNTQTQNNRQNSPNRVH